MTDGYRFRQPLSDSPQPGQHCNTMIVTIDGPAGSGKSTVARRLAERLGLLTTGPSGERMEVVASVDPLRTRPLGSGPDEPALLAEDFVSGLIAGELVNVVHYGRGRRAVTSRWSHPIA